MTPDPRLVLSRRIYYGWVIAAGCLLMTMVVFGGSYAFGVFYEAFVDEFAVSRSVLALVFGIQTVFIYVVGVVAGWLVDRHGQRRVVAGSTVVLTAGFVWTAFARSYAELLAAFGVVTAVGMAGLYVVAYATIPLWFDRRRGTAAGLASAGLGVGLVVVPPVADHFISLFGWGEAMLVIAGGVGVIMSVVTVLFADDPETVAAETSVEFDAAESGPTRADGATEGVRSRRAIIASLPFALAFVGWVFVFAPVYVVLSHIVLYASEIGIGRSIAVGAITIIGLTTTVTRLSVGTVSDRFGRTRTFLVCACLVGIATLGLGSIEWIGARSIRTGAFAGLMVLFGVGYGGCGGLVSPQVADLFGSHNLNTLFAAMSVSFAFAGLLAPPLAGLTFDTVGSYTPALAVAGVGAILGAGCVFGAARTVPATAR
ncbi:MFS transporter [Natrinema caseinilyticum]|uniref:MFS transporter n=1 Tax=Natrinema caseinilyticum TaxID=2961570 RepID=UPI0020C29B0F|nr:MFS transporter [Natrinema caseinilyticum]